MQKMIVSIPEPCHENWDKMSATKQGRFCNACAKEVIDFSNMSDAEMINYFSKLTSANICGRVYHDQLDREITKPQEIKKRKFWHWNYVAMLLFSFSKLSAAKAQGKMERVPETENTPQPNDKNKILTGSVVDHDGNALPFASVHIVSKRTGVAADAIGKYSIKVRTGDVVTISALNHKPKNIIVGDTLNILTVLDLAPVNGKEEIVNVLVGAISVSDMDYVGYSKLKHVAQFSVIDDQSGLPIPKASILIQNNGWESPKNVVTDDKGKYKLKGMKAYETFEIKVDAEGYNGSSFTINENDFKDRKGDWEIRLAKREIPIFKSMDSVIVKTAIRTNKELRGMLGGASFLRYQIIKRDSLFSKIKDIIVPNENKLKVFPNPAQRGSVFSLSLQLKKAGNNLLRIINAEGIIIMQKQIVATGTAQTETIMVDPRWAAGNYYVVIIDSSDKLLTKGSFIVQ